MIKEDEVYKIGKFNKPHGIHGEISFTFTDDIFDRTDCDYLVCLLDGIFVPFFVEEYRFRSDTTALIKLEGIQSSEKARMFTNVDVYFPVKYADTQTADDELTWNYFQGFQVIDIQVGSLGKLTDIDDSTENILFVVDYHGKELLIPAHEEFIVEIDKMHRTLTMNLPKGLLSLDEIKE